MTLTKIIADSFAWIEYLLSTEKGLHIKKILENKDIQIFTHVLSFAEIASRISRSGGSYQEPINSIVSSSEIINIDKNTSIHAGVLHSEIRKKIKDFGLVDAFILLAARDMNAKILTGDPHFKNMKEAIMI